MESQKYTIKDIANLAGVSKGTVDRVLHKRGKVSQKSLAAVNKVLDAIDFQPNILARSLKNSKVYRICALLPNPEKDIYWQSCVEGVNQAASEFKSFGIHIEIRYFNIESIDSFEKENMSILNQSPDAVLLAPLFQMQSIQIIEMYHANNIIVSIFNNQIDSKFEINYVGQALYKSGRVAARLMESIIHEKKKLVIIHIDEALNNANHMKNKEKGFRSYFDELTQDAYRITTLNVKNSELEDALAKYLNDDTDVSGIFVSTSKTYLVANALQKTNSNVKIVGYDLIEENVKHLKNKSIDYLIHQNPKQQTYLSIVYLAENFLFDKNIPRQKLLPIDIINSENVDSYV